MTTPPRFATLAAPAVSRVGAGSSLIGPLWGLSLRPVWDPRPAGSGGTHRGRPAARIVGRLPAVTEGTAARSQPHQTEWCSSEDRSPRNRDGGHVDRKPPRRTR